MTESKAVLDPHRVDLVKQMALLLRQMGEQMRRTIGQVAADEGLTASHFLFLGSIAEPTPMGELAGAMCLDASYVTGLVDRLEERGLVERLPDPDDRRRTLIAVTAAGRRLRSKVHRKVTLRSDLALRLDIDDLEQLTGLLRKALGVED